MAPIKRARAVVDDGELELTGIENVSPSLRQDTRKKARVSNSRSILTSEAGSNQAEEDGEGQAGAETREDGDYEHPQDACLNGSTDEERDTQRATQMIRQRNEKKMDNMPADNGIIESVTCVNFMCHTMLHVSLGPLINFIIGHNGSGKSAVLTAITLCLGGKATSTNRGQSLKSFIKEGQESATLTVKLKNAGYNGFQQETYGNSITVERHFSKAGASGFKIKSATGRVISTKKADLEEICDFWQLQIDNPMNVLTQDMARQFLNNSTPADKYKFFVKGVQLEQLDRDYQLLSETIDAIEHKLGNRVEDINVLRHRARKAAARLAMSDKHDSLREKIRSYSNQMAWAQVEQQEKASYILVKALETMDQNLRKADQRIEKAEHDAKKSEEALDNMNRIDEETHRAVTEIKIGLGPLQDNRRQAKEVFDANKKELLDLQVQQRSIRDHMVVAQDRIAKFKLEIAEEHRRLEDVDGGTHTRRLADIEDAKAKAQEAKDQYDQHSEDANRLEANGSKAAEDVQDAQGPIEAKKMEIRQCETLLQSLSSDRGQQNGAFNENMPRLLRTIQEERGFQEGPIGPVARHVQLLKPVWSSILEKSFGATLNSFIVTSKKDQILLSNVMRRVNCVCPILIGNHHPIDTSQNEPDPHFDTVLRVLEVDNDLVRRQLIINQGIEQTILIEDRNEANIALFDGVKPHNVKQGFCLNESKRGWGVRLGYSRGGEPTTTPISAWQGKPRMKIDVESQISYQREMLQQHKKEFSELEKRLRDTRDNLTKCDQAMVRHRRRQKELQLFVQRAEELVDNLQDELEKSSPQDGHLDALKAGLKDAEDENTVFEASYEDVINGKDKLNNAARELNKQLHAIDRDIHDGDAKIRKAEAKAFKSSEQRQSALLEKNKLCEIIENASGEKACEEEKHQKQVNLIAVFIGKATSICPRTIVDPGETPTSLDKKLEKLENDLDRFNKEIGGTRESIAREAVETQQEFRTAQRQIEDLEQLAQLLKIALINRIARWKKFQQLISTRARAQFTYLLSERGFRGALKTDHKQRILDLHVEPDETKTGKGRQTKTLSGGEKSFSTICLLLSLWEAMGSPIRCLDEFDVFMDSVNRDVSMRMMIIAARRSVGRQYILITPQSMGNVDVAGDVKIIRLSDPERGQTILPFAG
ncbi:MAG: Structural maintenance of chromosomes protein 6 [Pycnora praestabilis]|nr:MAG: Structural maintenance of chromosomes protein 6 [Pycnora praestabilis]